MSIALRGSDPVVLVVLYWPLIVHVSVLIVPEKLMHDSCDGLLGDDPYSSG